MIRWMAVTNPRVSSVFLKVVGAEQSRAKDIRTVNILDFTMNSLVRMAFTPLTFQYFASRTLS